MSVYVTAYFISKKGEKVTPKSLKFLLAVAKQDLLAISGALATLGGRRGDNYRQTV